MSGVRGFILGVGVGLILVSCAEATFSYTYYGLQAASYAGKLLAVDPSKDADLSLCAPTPGNAGKCIVMLGPDFYALKQDYLSCQNQLVSCQHQR